MALLTLTWDVSGACACQDPNLPFTSDLTSPHLTFNTCSYISTVEFHHRIPNPGPTCINNYGSITGCYHTLHLIANDKQWRNVIASDNPVNELDIS